MLLKPSKQSSTSIVSGVFLVSDYANDGNTSTASMTYNEPAPYWQGDLQGYYDIHNITITSDDTYGRFI